MNGLLDHVVNVGPDLAVRATVLFAVAGGLSLALSRGSAAQRHLVWATALAGSLAVPLVYSAAPKWHVWPWSSTERIGATASPSAALPGDWPDASALVPVPLDAAATAPASSAIDPPEIALGVWFIRTASIGRILATLWLTGVLCAGTRLLLGFVRLRAIMRRAEPARGRTAALVGDLARRAGIRRPVRGLVSGEPIAPLTCGWSHPVVLLPAEVDSWPDQRLRVVLLHELAHVRRLDFVTQLVGEVARGVYWFHPLAWWALQRLRVDQEAACDDRVLAAGTTADDYAEDLLAVMARIPQGFSGSGVALAMGRAERIEARVRSILASDRNRHPVGTWRLAVVTSLFAALAVATAVVTPAAAQERAQVNRAATDPPPDATGTDGAALSAESVERLEGIAAGQFQIEPTREDVTLVLRALHDGDSALGGRACLAVETMAPKRLFAPADMLGLWKGLRPKLRSDSPDTRDWSARALAALAQHTDLLAGGTLDEAFDETMEMVTSGSAESRRHGAVVAGRLAGILPDDKLETLVRALLADETDASASGMVTLALCRAAPRIESPSLADDVAARLLAAIEDGPAGDAVAAWPALAHLAGTTSRETRERIVDAILAAIADPRWAISTTSGVRSLPTHAGAEALAILAPSLSREDLERAEKALPPRDPGQSEEAHDSMFAAAKGAVAARKAVIEQGTRPSRTEEEDVAFFEKRYGTTITGVKPKEEYPDPDLFYSAIGEQLGIPEIAWKAAAEKFGWTKDDGRQTFAILKGGPTSEGGEGSWDVMFIRSTIDPDTKKPVPTTIERVMVQIDYDGNVTFPQLPR